MRRQLVLAAVAVTATVVLAFCLPLARFVQDAARDRAIATAERDAERVAGALAVTTDQDLLEQVVVGTEAGSDQRLAVILPDGSSVGRDGQEGEDIDLARASPEAFAVAGDDGILWLTPVPLAEGVAVVRVAIPAEDVERGVAGAWALLTVVAAALLVIGVTAASRLAGSIARPAVALARAATRVADGDLTTRVTPAGPPELERAAIGFNDLAGRVSSLVEAERQGVADLAHRLRTPLAAMRLDAEAIGDGGDRSQVLDDIGALEQAVDTVIREARRPGRHAEEPASDLAEVARQRVAFWSVLAEEQGRPWQLVVPPGALPVPVARDELEAVVDALLDNIFTHTPSTAGFAVTVESALPGAARLVVRDRGPGFAATSHDHSATEPAGRTGLGLDIARRAADAAGGMLTLDDDGGAVVTLELPLAPAGATMPPGLARRHRPHLRRAGQMPS